ncbi:MAG: hypothetical protein GY754_04315 [bacterium]|nr:hypothetical protein [bacterium]
MIKYCREQLESIESYLVMYKKIAVIHPPKYSNVSEDPGKLDFFTSETEAKKWFLLLTG